MRCFMSLFEGRNFSLIYSISGKWAVVPYYQTLSFNPSITLPALKSMRARREVAKAVVLFFNHHDKKGKRVHIYPTVSEAWDQMPLPCGLSVAVFSNTLRTLPVKTMRDAINQCRDERMVVLSRGKWWAIDLNVSNERVLINL